MQRKWTVILWLVLLTAVVYWPVGGHDFIHYDDPAYVTENPVVQAGLTWDGVAWAFGELHGPETYWHPLTWLSHMLDAELFGLNPAGHHWMNVFFHTINAVLVFLVFCRLTGAFWSSAILGALFALHPLQVDTVAWVSERKNVLSAMFWLLTMGAYVRFAREPSGKRYAPVALLFTLGLLCKPILVTLPFALLLLDYWPLRRWARWQPASAPAADPAESPAPYPARKLGLLLLEKVPLLVIALGASIVTILAHRSLGMLGQAGAEFHLPLMLRIENAFVAYARYLGKTLWPSNLAVFYPHPGQWPTGTVLVAVLLVAAISALVIWQWRRRPYLFVGWFWFIGVLVPAIGIIQVGHQSMADRFAYLPVLGLFLLLVWGIAEATRHLRHREPILRALTLTTVGALILVTGQQVVHWKNSITLFQHAVRATPDNFVAHHNLAVLFTDRGRLDEARQHAMQAARIKPIVGEPWLQLGLILTLQDKPEQALEYYRNALRANPLLMARIKAMAAELVQQRKLPAARAQYTALLQLVPDYAEAYAELAALLAAQQQPAEAIRHYRESLRFKPDRPDVLNNLAWLLATHPDPAVRDGAEAVRLAERACTLDQQQHALFRGTLAAAYAEAGRFADAVNAAREARLLAQQQGQTALAEVNQRLQHLYEQNQPYREKASD